jgi:hypothetical protein
VACPRPSHPFDFQSAKTGSALPSFYISVQFSTSQGIRSRARRTQSFTTGKGLGREIELNFFLNIVLGVNKALLGFGFRTWSSDEQLHLPFFQQLR